MSDGDTIVVKAYGMKYVVDKRSSWILKESYEPFMTRTVRLSEKSVFIDVGAHVGKYSFYAAKQIADGTVVALEPFPKNIVNLKKGIVLNGFNNIVVCPVACSDHEGTSYMEHGQRFSTGGAHLVQERERSLSHINFNKVIRNSKTVEVKLRMLDNIVEELGLDRVDMIKIDVEGHEWDVIKGAKRTIEKFNPKLQIEVFVINASSVIAYLSSLGYDFKMLIKMNNIYEMNLLFTK